MEDAIAGPDHRVTVAGHIPGETETRREVQFVLYTRTPVPHRQGAKFTQRH